MRYALTFQADDTFASVDTLIVDIAPRHITPFGTLRDRERLARRALKQDGYSEDTIHGIIADRKYYFTRCDGAIADVTGL